MELYFQHFGLHLFLYFLQPSEPEQLPTPNKTRARGPAGRRLPSFKHSKQGRGFAGDIVQDSENNNVEDDKDIDVVTVIEEHEDSTLLEVDETSLTRRLWNSCQIL